MAKRNKRCPVCDTTLLFDTHTEMPYRVQGKLIWMHIKCREAIKEVRKTNNVKRPK